MYASHALLAQTEKEVEDQHSNLSFFFAYEYLGVKNEK